MNPPPKASIENRTESLRTTPFERARPKRRRMPSVETVAAGKYPVSRPLQFYVKKAHIGVVPGLKEYVEFFSSDKMIGPEGPLAEYGLVPSPDAERAKLQEDVKAAKSM